MKKYKSLFRCQVGGYIIWLFGVILMPMMMIKYSAVVVILLEVLAAIILAGEIVAHVFFVKKRELYPIVSFASHGLANAFILFGLIFEIVLSFTGQLGLYALIMFAICTAFYALIDVFLVMANIKVLKGTIDKDKFEL